MSATGEIVEFEREATVVRIPAGTPAVVPPGTRGDVVQSLGGSWTIRLHGAGELVRVSGADVAAIGKEPPEETTAISDGPLEEQVWQALRACYDPEIPVNIVDLGLVYDLEIEEGGGGAQVSVQMTLTAPGCGMGETIAEDARQRILSIDDVAAAQVDIVWDPPWNPRMISDEGKRTLGLD